MDRATVMSVTIAIFSDAFSNATYIGQHSRFLQWFTRGRVLCYPFRKWVYSHRSGNGMNINLLFATCRIFTAPAVFTPHTRNIWQCAYRMHWCPALGIFYAWQTGHHGWCSVCIGLLLENFLVTCSATLLFTF